MTALLRAIAKYMIEGHLKSVPPEAVSLEHGCHAKPTPFAVAGVGVSLDHGDSAIWCAGCSAEAP